MTKQEESDRIPLMFKKEILPRINALWRDPLIIIFTGLMSLLSVGFSLADGSGKSQHWCARTWSRFIFRVSRVKLTVRGLEKLESGRGYVFVSNHISIFDIWAFLAHIPYQFRFVAKISLFRIPFLGWHMRRIGNIPVDHRTPRKVLKSYQEASEKIKSGISIVIFPEGSRTDDGAVAPFKRGAFLLPRHAKAPIVPVTIIGSHLRLKRGRILIYPGPMEMVFHDPIPWETYQKWSLEELARETREIVLSCYRLEL